MNRIRKGSIVIRGDLNDLGLVIKEEKKSKKGFMLNFIIIDKDGRETYWPVSLKNELTFLAQCRGNIKTLKDAVLEKHEEIIEVLLRK